jgi:thiol:disulfide interchange protein DsbD
VTSVTSGPSFSGRTRAAERCIALRHADLHALGAGAVRAPCAAVARKPAPRCADATGMRGRTLAALALLLCAVAAPAAQLERNALPETPAGASDADAYDEGVARVRARLLVDAPDSPDDVWRAGVLFELAPGWHLYWRHPGETGLPTRLELSLEDGEVGPLAWPAPAAFLEDDFLANGYADAVLLAAPLAPTRDGALLRARAELLVCEFQCLPASFDLSRPLVAETDPQARAAVQALFSASAAAVPRPAAQYGVEVEARFPRIPAAEGGTLAGELRIRRCSHAPPACGAAQLVSNAVPLFVHEPATWQVRAEVRPDPGDALVLALSGEAQPGARVEGQPLRGVLTLRDATGAELPVEIEVPIQPASASAAFEPAPPPAGSSLAALLRALLFGFAGGLVLNLMPCVLPVLALKLFALAGISQQSRREVFAHTLAYTAGILLTLGALALCVLLLRASGQAVGWGFQLQEPLFVAAIAALLVTFATNLFGAFELHFVPQRLAGIGAEASGAARSFFDGLLAVVLATPCSAPFLGTAVGFAFASPAPIVLAIFTAIGLGLAAPFAAVSLWPGLARWLPRGGAWMDELRRGLAFALLLTVVWLLWVTGRQSGVDAAMGLLALLLCVAVAGWLYGLAQRARGQLGAGVLLVSVAAILLVGHGRVELAPHGAPTDTAAQPFERTTLDAALAAGRPVFVYYTADWCITCKLNERRVLDTPRAREELARHGYTVLRADWTRRDAAVSAELAKLGRAGVPVYALYAPGGSREPRLLPDLLSLEGFTTALREVASGARVARAGAAGALP